MNHKMGLLVMAGLLAGSLSGCTTADAFSEGVKKEAPETVIKVAYEMPVAGEAEIMTKAAMEKIPPKGTIRVASIGSPYVDILKEAGDILKQKGYDLKIVLCEDYSSPNEKVAAKEADGNFFQHSAYLERYNLEKETLLKEAAVVYFQPLAIYPGKLMSLQEKKEHMKILVPASVTGYARALFLLQQEGFLTLAEDADLMAAEEDIRENPLSITIIKAKDEEIWEKRQEADFIICDTSVILSKGAHPEKEALAMEKEDSLAAVSFGQSLVTLKESEQKLLPLTEVLCSPEMREFIRTHYQGSLKFKGEILTKTEETEEEETADLEEAGDNPMESE